MKKLLKLFAVCSIVLAAVSVVGLCAADNADAAPAEPAAAATYGGLDIGSYGWSSPEEYGWDTDIIYSVARYKNTTEDCAGNVCYSAESVGGGWVKWCVHCVSDGQNATDYAYIRGGSYETDTADYYYSYGTKGYTNRLHMVGHQGSMGAGIYVSKAAWCPDGDTATIKDYINSRL